MDESAKETRADRARLRSAARRDAERLELRETILAIARRQLIANGYARFSMREVAEEAGYTPTALYHYFEDRDSLLREVTRGFYAQFTAMCAAAHHAVTEPRERLIGMAQAYVRFASEQPAVFRLMFMERPEMGAGATRERIDADPNFRLVLASLKALAEMGATAVANFELVGLRHWASIHGLAAMFVTMDLISLDQLFPLARSMSEINIAALGRA